MNEKLAIALGVNEENIIISEKPKDTQEEAIFSKKIVGENPFVLVTSASHIPRSMALFKSLGLKPIAAPTAFYKGSFKGFFRLPTMGSFQVSQIAMHEYWGILWSKLKELIK